MTTWQSIGLAAAAIAILCALGIAAWHLFKPAGKHAKPRHEGQHRLADEPEHPGAGSEGHEEELARIQLVLDAARRHRDQITGS